MIKIRILKIVVLFIFLILQGCGVDKETVDTKCNGKGKITYSNSIYVGECKNGKREGHGILTFSDGENYDGQWENDKKNGTGIFSWSDGTNYSGEWKNDKKEGHGILTYSDGEKYDGHWHNDKKNGIGKTITQEGICEEKWKENKLIEIINQNSYEEAYIYFNNIRKQAGMIELEPNGILQEVAQNHSNYAQLHYERLKNDPYINDKGLTGHDEEANMEGFTGVSPSDRAIAQGWLYYYGVSEGMSSRCTAKVSINNLMIAMYHRLGILNFSSNTIGIGFTQENNSIVREFVNDIANSNLNDLCKYDSYSSGTYYDKVCANDLTHRIEFDDFNNAINDIKKKNPKYVIWPAKNSIDNLYKFTGEAPSPMPDYNQTGNPISIQFNDYYYPNDIEMQSFKLFKNKKEIKETRILTKETDPNKFFSKYEFALFPLNVLEKNTTYNAIFNYKYNNVIKSIEWSFKTIK